MKNNPYIGPRPFERSDRDRFFGRARETRDLLSLIMAERVVLFYAQSGAGKTSLLNTQIVPALEEEGFQVLPIARVGSDAPRGVEAASVKNIFSFSALLTLAGPQGEVSLLYPQTLKSFLASIIDDEHPPVVIFDQFEELLTTHRGRWQDARGFFEQLRDALQAIPKLGVVLAMREDHVAGLDPYAALLPKRLKTRFRMELLGYDGALEAVKKPAQNAGCAYGTGVAERLVDDLRRIQVTAHSTGESNGALGPYIEPVQLQVVCSRLWENLPEREERIITWPEIEQFGNIDRALTDFYESALQHTAQQTRVTERQLRRWFGTELITPMKTRGLALRGERDTNGLPNEAVDVLDRQHLIRAEARAGAYWYELAHDRLVEPIVNSNAAYEQARMTSFRITAKKWQESKAADLLYGGTLLEDALRFTRTHPDDMEDYERDFLAASAEAQRIRARNRVVRLAVITALSVGMIIMAALAILAFQSKQEADRQSAIAYEAKAIAEAGQQEAEQQRQIARTAESKAMAQQTEAESQARNARRALANQLAVQVNDTRSEFPQRSLLLGVEALSTTLRMGEPRVAAAEEALRQTLAETGGRRMSDDSVASRILPGNDFPVAISPDQHWLVTVDDGSLRLWNLNSNDPAATAVLLSDNASNIDTAAFSLDNRWLITIDRGKSASLWDLANIAADHSVSPIALRVHTSAADYTGTVDRDADFIATTLDDHWLVTVDGNSSARVWDVSTSELATIPKILRTPDITVTTLAISPDAHWMVTGGFSEFRHISRAGTPAYLWDLTAPDPLLTRRELQGFQGPIFATAFSLDARWMYTASVDEHLESDLTVRQWDLTAANPAANPIALPELSVRLGKFQIDPDNYWLAVAAERGMHLLDLSATPPLSISLPNAAFPVAFSGSSHWLATGSNDNRAQLWDLNAYNPADNPIVLPRGHEDRITAITFSSDDRWLITGSDDKTIRMWDLSAAGPVEPYSIRLSVGVGSDDPARITTSADKRWLAIGGDDGNVRLLDVSDFKPGEPLTLPGNEFQQLIWATAISHDNHWLAAATYHGPIRLIDLAGFLLDNTKIVSRTLNEDSGFSIVAFTHDNRWLVTMRQDGPVRLWDLTAADLFAAAPVELQTRPGNAKVATSSDDNRWLVIADEANAYLWDLNAIETMTQPLALPDAHAPIVISSNSHWLATGSGNGLAQLWDLAAPDPTAKPITLPVQNTSGLFFSPDSNVLITSDSSSVPRLWDLTGPDPVVSPTLTNQPARTNNMAAIAMSPDNRWLVQADSYDPNSYLWDLTLPTAKPVVLQGPAREVLFSADNHWLIATDGQTIRRWTLRLDEVIDVACQTAGRNFTRAEWGQYFPDQPYRQTCDHWPLEDSGQ